VIHLSSHMEQVAYMVAALLFILGIQRLSKVKTARSGNRLAAVGMLLAVLVALAIHTNIGWPVLAGGLVTGAIIGALLAMRVQMTGMPELVALFNGLGGAASAFVALSDFTQKQEGAFAPDYAVAIGLSILIGAVTLSGSLIAYGKLAGKIWKNRLGPIGTQGLNAVLFLLAMGCAVWAGFLVSDPETAFQGYLALSGVALLLGIGLVMPIGGADMPVVISLLNSYSGLAACATGFVLENNLLIVAGSLVGASGLILTRVMCKAMNRSLANVLFATFGEEASTGGGGDDGYTGVKSATADEVAPILDAARRVIIAPGYGMAVAQAQHKVRELADLLEKRGCKVEFAIHPVAGRMPGHMNVLLAEADVPYDKLFELEAINGEFSDADVAIVLGANDVCNPSAIEDPGSAIAGMPVLNVWDAGTVMVIKRSLSAGYAGIKNPLFERDNTLMLFGDAKQMISDLVSEISDL